MSNELATQVQDYLASQESKIAESVLMLASQNGSYWTWIGEGCEKVAALMNSNMSDEPVALVYDEDGEIVLAQWAAPLAK